MNVFKKNYARDKKPLIGAHMSIKGGFHKAIENGQLIGCSAIQVFSKSNRQWHAKAIAQEDVHLFKQALTHYAIDPSHVIVHASYLINIASGNQKIAAQSAKALEQELERCHTLGLTYLVLHPGSATETSCQKAMDQIISYLDHILTTNSSSVVVLLENMAGQGNSIGSTFEELSYIIRSLSADARKRVGICIDTCHLFAAGYAFNTPTEYKKMWTHFDTLIGLSSIKAFHINDSKTACGSHVDRHEHIGKGKIGIDGFKLLLNDELFITVPKIIETPEITLDDHRTNLAVLYQLYAHNSGD